MANAALANPTCPMPAGVTPDVIPAGVGPAEFVRYTTLIHLLHSGFTSMPRGRKSSSDGPQWPVYRSHHRQRSHREVHEEAGDVADPSLKHPLVPAGEPELITKLSRLRALVAELQDAERFGYDTEFIGEQSYFPRICLIQVAVPDRVILIDALASIDLDPFWALLADQAVEKIVHAGDQDVEPVMRYHNRPAATIFDTQIAAGFIGERYPSSLNGLIESLLGIKLGRGTKFSQWDHRPLSARQLQYAANDVRYLLLLHDRIRARLEELGNGNWATQECAGLSDPGRFRVDPADQRLRVRGVEYLNHEQRTVLRALLRWRDEAARTHDVPPRAIVKDAILLELARNPVTAPNELGRVRGLPRPVRQHWGETIVQTTRSAIEQAKTTDPPSTGPPWRSSADVRSRVKALWEAISAACAERSIDPTLVTSKKELSSLVLSIARVDDAQSALNHSRLNRGWRRELLGSLLDEHFPG